MCSSDLVDDGRIAWFGPAKELDAPRGCDTIDAEGGSVVPGLIDCHTHTVFAGTREGEFVQRLEGKAYAEIAESGGGIRVSGSVAVMRASSSLLAKSARSIARTPSRASVAPSRVSRRRPALRLAASGPWHWKQFSESTGRMSRLKSIPAASGLAKPTANAPTKTVASARRRKFNGMNGLTKKTARIL